MGCDVHISIFDKTVLDTGLDLPFSTHGHLPRSYSFFYGLAGVRGACDSKIIPISYPRGRIDNIDYESLFRINIKDLHSFTWLTSDEFSKVYTMVSGRICHLGGELSFEYLIIKDILSLFEEKGRPHIAVIAFDN